MKNVLLVEDELHKRDELTACLEDYFRSDMKLSHVDSVHEAFWAVSAYEFDLIVLDMALPTFSTDGSATERGLDQAMGGVEVLRALKSRGISTKIIIISQHPDISVGGSRLKLSAAADVLSKRYSQEIVGAVVYKYRSPANSTKLTALLRKVI